MEGNSASRRRPLCTPDEPEYRCCGSRRTPWKKQSPRSNCGRILFTLGSQTLIGVTDATGVAVVSLTPTMTPGAVPLSIAFAGGAGYSGSAAAVLLAIHRDDTALVYTGRTAVIVNDVPL